MSQRSQAASWIADEYGGSYLNNPQQQNRDLAAAHDMAVLIQRTVQANGGDYRRTGELINETLDELSGRAPFGFVTPAFALGMTQVLLDRANRMPGPEFVQYLEGIRDRDNPLFFWQRTTLDPLMDEVKERTRAHVDEIYGRSTFSVFDGMKGQHGPLAFGAGAADAVLEEVGGGTRGILLAASNPVEAGRQAVDMLRTLDRVPEALQQQVREARELIDASRLDDYHKGFLTARVAIIALDAADVVETGLSLGNLARRLRNGDVNNIGDALQALDDGPRAMRRDSGGSPDASPGTPGGAPAQYRALSLSDVGDAAVAHLPPERQPAYRQALDEALQARGITDPERAGRFVADLNGAPDGPTMQGIHRRAAELIYGRPAQNVSDIVNAAAVGAPDNVEWAYQRAMQRTLREQGIDTPEGAQGYLRNLDRDPAAMQALHQRAYAEVLDNAVAPLPINAQDYYRRAIDGLAREKGHDSISEVQTYLGNLAGAPNGPSMQAVHNRAYGLLVDDTLQSLPGNVRPLYREALDGILQERGMATLSDARGYIDRLGGAPNGQSMQALHNRAYDVMLDNTLEQIPESARPAYRQTLGQIFQERGLDTLSAQQTHIANLAAAPDGPSMRAVHNRAFDTVVDNAVNALPDAQRPAYREALREQFTASGADTVAEAQRYVVDLANSPQAMARLHDHADAILNPANPSPVANAATLPPHDDTSALRDFTVARTEVVAPPPFGNDPLRDRDRLLLNPASQPDDPLLPFHAVARTERMQSPAPVGVDGRSYDVLGMTAGGELQLRPPTDNVRTVPDNAMFVQTPTTPADLRPGAEVVYSGRTWRVGEPVEAGQLPGVAERSHRLVDPHNDSATALVPESRADEIFKRVGREVSYEGRQWEFGAATGRGYVLIDPANRENTKTVALNEADQIRMRFAGGTEYTLQGLQNGVLRVAPSEPSGDLSYRPLPGESFEARLKNRELEGVYSIRVGENGELTATGRIRNGTEVSERIQPSDIAPRHVGVDSPEFDQRFQVDAFLHREAETRARAIATEPTGLPVRDPNLGAMPETVRPQVLLGVSGLDAQADFIRRHAAEVTPGTEPRLTVFNIGFSNQGEAQRVVDAMVDFRREHPDARIEVVAERTRFESASRNEGYGQFLQTLRDNGVQLNFFENGDTSRQVIHAKGVIVNDQVLFTTGAVIDGSKNKVDIATELPPEAARSFIRFFDEGINGNADPATRQQMLADMSRQGVLVDDPVTRTPYISRTQDALINGAENRLFISLSDLTNPDTTRTIIDRVRNGVDVEIQYREMDPTSRQLLDRAMQEYPDRLRVENISNWDPRPHYNVIVADDKQGYVGTSYLWPNQQQQIHHTRSFENGVLLQGESVRQLQSQMEALRSLQPPNPGQRLLNPAPDDAPDVGVRLRNDTTGSISISAPANSSIGVDVRDSTVNGSIQTVSGSGNVQVAGNRETLGTAAVTSPDANGNVQVTDMPGLRIELQNPGTSGRTGTDVRIDNSTVNGGVQSIVGNDNVQIDLNEARINGERRQTVTDGDNNRQTQNLGGNVTADSVTQTIDGRSDSRQQIGNDVPPVAVPIERTPPADNRRAALPDASREPGLDDPRHPNHTMFASALDRIQTFERDRGIDSGDFARNLAGGLTVSAVESRLPQINHVVFNAEGTRAFAVDTPNLDAEWRRVAYTDVASAGQQSLAASSERLQNLQPPALSQPLQQDAQPQLNEPARNAARMA